MFARLVVVGMVSLVIAASACDSDEKAVKISEIQSPTPTATIPHPPSDTPEPETVTLVPTAVPTPSITPTQAEMLTDLELNRTKWNNAGLEDYQYGFVYRCFGCFGDAVFTVVVQDGELYSLTAPPDVALGPGTEYLYDQVSTVPLLFELAEKTIREYGGARVSYDASYGFPTEVGAAYTAPAPDTGFYTATSNFEALP